MRVFNNSTAGVYRQTYTGNLSTFTQQFSTVGYLRSLDPLTASANGFQYGYGYSFIAEFGTDIQVGDKLLIGTLMYTVKGVNQNAEASNPTAYLKAIITLPE